MYDRHTMSVPEAAALLGISRGLAYEGARNGDIPTIRIGRRLVVPTARLLEMLGNPPSNANGSATAMEPPATKPDAPGREQG
jgi:excisionase family DNA binding protein